ncbi:MAG: PAS domain S-box protein [Rhodoferax sp.]|nr:PAS domain S-box protein [Rhodoferax sp.]MCF8210025.1 PAS domain S-box protein [Rhodoferax sp.]
MHTIRAEETGNTVAADTIAGLQQRIRELEDQMAERDRSSRSLQLVEAKYQSILEDSGNPIFAFSPQGEYLFVNQAFAEGVGKAREDLIGHTIWDVFPHHEAQHRFDAVKWVFENAQSKTIEVTIPLPDSIRDYVTTIKPILGANGGVGSVVCTSVDVTERNTVLRALRDNELRWEFALEGAGDGVWDWHIQTGAAHYSKRWKEMLGYADHEIGSGADEWVNRLHPDDTPMVMGALQDHVAGKNPDIRIEYRMRCKDGTWMWVLARGMVFKRDAAGAPVRVVGTNTDITERKHAEQRDQHHKLVLQMLTSRAPLLKVLDTIARDFESLYPGMWCSISLLDDSGKVLRHAAAPSLPNDYQHAMDGHACRAEGTYGERAVLGGSRAVVGDIAGHPDWEVFRDLARGAGLSACWSEPIVSETNQILGSFSVYHAMPIEPTTANLQWMEHLARLTALAIDKSRAHARLQLAASVFTHAREGIMITRADGTIIEVNESFSRITGFGREEALGANPRILKSGRQPLEYYAAMWLALKEQGHWYGEVWNRRKNGEVYASLINVSSVYDESDQMLYYVALFADITPIKEHERKLEHFAHYDPLTGLPNRVLLADRLHQALAQSQRRNLSLALVYLDLDGFKAVNDHHGHDQGDELLVTLARRMRDALREGDTLARIGGDEFVAVLVDLEDVQDCKPVLDRIQVAAAQAVESTSGAMRVSVSMGVALYPQHGNDIDLLKRCADQAMYVAKQEGKNCYRMFAPLTGDVAG